MAEPTLITDMRKTTHRGFMWASDRKYVLKTVLL